MRRANLELHIEELVLHGFAPGDRRRIGDAVERELARLFAAEAPRALAQGAEIERLDAGSFRAAQGSTPEAIGAQIAQALYGGLGG